MPERTKKRKNNKNKRKNNKNNRPEAPDNSHNIDVSVSLSADVKNDEDKNQQCETGNMILDSAPTEKNIQVNSLSSSNTECDEVNEPVNKQTENKINNICSSSANNVIFDCNLKSESSAEEICKQHLHVGESSKQEEYLETYVVESPDQSKKPRSKLSTGMKSKSVDNDDSPTIVEVTDDTILETDSVSNSVLNNNNTVIISDVDPEVQWQKIDDLKTITISTIDNVVGGASSITTVPLNTAQCNQTKSLSSEEEVSLRSYLRTLNLSTNPEIASTSDFNSELEQVTNREARHMLRKRALTEDSFFQRAGPTRCLAVIDEEGSSESSMTSRRQSYLSDKKSDNEELEDEVFESKTIQVSKRNLDNVRKPSRRTIPQECIRVDAKIKEPEITEARGDWTTKTIEKMTGAEIVYLTDSSSSTSSLYDLNDDAENSEDSDISVRIITPTIEVTDTEKLLTNSFSSKSYNDKNSNQSENANKMHVTSNVNKIESENELNSHVIVIDSTENLKTNLIVKDISDTNAKNEDFENQSGTINNLSEIKKHPKDIDEYDLEIKVLKCELNDAINTLIKEVTSDSESAKDSPSDLLSRQDSSSSLGSSQCTAKYNPTHSSLNDVSNVINDSHDDTNTAHSHVKDVLEHVSESALQKTTNTQPVVLQPQILKDLCLQKISLLPYGDKIIEELANVSQRLHNLSALGTDISHISKSKSNIYQNDVVIKCTKDIENATLSLSQKHSVPPPTQPRKSSLKKCQDEQKVIVSPQSITVYECLSPSQKVLMEKTNTVVQKDETDKIPEHQQNHKNDIIVTTDNSIKDTSNMPFKSQTGSRLLSLICDKSLKNNVNSALLRSLNRDLDEIPKNSISERLRSHESTEYLSCCPSYKTNTLSSSSSMFRSLSPPKLKKFSSSFYESDDSSDVTERTKRTIHNEKKFFHYSTGNLNKDIEDDISSIQNMHRHYTNIRDVFSEETRPRRPSLPKDLCDKQMDYIREKEKEIDAEIQRLENQKQLVTSTKIGPRAPMIQEKDNVVETTYNSSRYTSKNDQLPTKSPKFKSSLFSSSEEELRRDKMYSEYVKQMAEREFRKEQKVIKITKPLTIAKSTLISKSMPLMDMLESKVNNRIEREFITKARERWDKLGIKDSDTEDERDMCCDVYSEPKIIEHKIKVLEAGEERDVNKLPNHLQDFVKFAVKEKDQRKGSTGESEPEKQPAHVVVLCAVFILMLTVSRYFLRLLRNK